MVIDGKIGYTGGVNLSDDKYAIVGTINLDYRSLVHHFENGVWLYKHEVLKQIRDDLTDTMSKSMKINISQTKVKQRINKSMVFLPYQMKQNKFQEGDQKHGKVKVSRSK